MPEYSIADRLELVRERIERACARARRDPASVRLLAVTKIFGPEVIREAWNAGLREFGENYVQEMERKATGRVGSGRRALPPDRPSAIEQDEKSGAVVFSRSIRSIR